MLAMNVRDVMIQGRMMAERNAFIRGSGERNPLNMLGMCIPGHALGRCVGWSGKRSSLRLLWRQVASQSVRIVQVVE
jgi:hypothetical protein